MSGSKVRERKKSVHADDLVDALNRHGTRTVFSSKPHGLRNSLYDASAKSAATVSAWISRLKRTEVTEEEQQVDRRLLEHLRAYLAPGFNTAVVMDELTHYTLAEKCTMLNEFESDAVDSKLECTKTASEAAALLKKPMELTAGAAKAVDNSLAACSSEWIDNFVAEGGVEWLLECLRFSAYWCRSLNRLEVSTASNLVTKNRNSGSNGSAQPFPGVKLEIVPEDASEEGASAQPSQPQHTQRMNYLYNAALSFFRKASSEQQERLFGHASCLIGVLRCTEFISKELLSDSFLLFSGMSVLSHAHRTAVVESWEAVALPYQPFFKAHLLPELRKGRDFRLKLAYFTFANVFILHCMTVAERWHARCRYLPVKLIRKFARFVSLYPDEAFAFQLSNFREELIEDVDAFPMLAEANSKYLDVALPCWREVSAAAPPQPEQGEDDELATETESATDSESKPRLVAPDEDAPAPPEDASDGELSIDDAAPAAPLQPPGEDAPSPPEGEEGLKEDVEVVAEESKSADDAAETAAPPLPGAGPPPPPGAGPPPPPMDGVGGAKDPNRPKMKPFFVAKLENVDGTLFAETDVNEFEDMIDHEMLERDFARKPAKAVPVITHSEGSSEPAAPKHHTSFLSGRGAQPTFQVQIILRGFTFNRSKTAMPSEIVQKVADADQEFFTTSELEKLLSLFPVVLSTGEPKYPEEEKLAQAVTPEELETYDKAERFMYDLYMLGSPAEKLATMIFSRQAPKLMAQIPELLETIKPVAERVKTKEVCSFLAAVVATANYMNNSSRLARGMDLKSLNKLSDIKTADSSRSLLHVLIEMLRERKPELVCLDEKLEPRKDFHYAQKAMTQLLEVQRQLRKGLASMRKTKDFAETELTTSVQKAVEELSKDIATVKQTMAYLGYGEAETDPAGFFALWSSFLKTYTVSRQWVEDRANKRDKPESKKHQLLNSAQSLTATFRNSGKGEDEHHVRPLAIPSAIKLLASSDDFHRALRGSREDVFSAVRDSQE